MDDYYDAYLYSIDGPELFEEGESENDVLDNIDEDKVHADTPVVLVPASQPTREEQGDDEKEPEPTSSTVSKLMMRCNRSARVSLSRPHTYTQVIQSIDQKCVSYMRRVSGVVPINLEFGFSEYRGKQGEIIQAAISGERVPLRVVAEPE